MRDRLQRYWLWQERILRRFSIKSRLLGSYVLVVMLPLLIVAAVSFFISYSDAKEKFSFYSEQVSKQLLINLNATLSDYEDVAKTIMRSELIQTDFKAVSTMNELRRFRLDDEIGKLLSSLSAQKLNIDGITVMHMNGTYRMFTGNRMVPRRYADTKLFIQTVNTPAKAVWLPPHPNEIGGIYSSPDKVITYSSLIKDRWSGQDLGVVAIAIKPDVFERAFEGVDSWTDGNVFILDAEGSIIYSRNTDDWGKRENDLKLVGQIFGDSGRPLTTTFDYMKNGTRFFVSTTLVADNGWAIVSMVPYSNLLQKTNVVLKFTVAVILLFLLFAAFISLSVSYSISNAIGRLMKSIRQVERGDFQIRVDVNGRDEIMRLHVFYKRMVERLDYHINELLRARLLNKEVQIQALKAQVNPHFLYNTLETISSIAKVKQVPEISRLTGSLSAMFRYSIKGDQDFVRVEDEIANVNHYMSILQIRFGPKLEWRLDIGERTKQRKVLKLILQPLLENAVRHGIERKKGSGEIRLSVEEADGMVLFRIADNGLGMSPERLEDIRLQLEQDDEEAWQPHGGGIGLRNVVNRLRLYYQDRFRYAIESTAGAGTEVQIRIPAEDYAPEQGDSETAKEGLHV